MIGNMGHLNYRPLTAVHPRRCSSHLRINIPYGSLMAKMNRTPAEIWRSEERSRLNDRQEDAAGPWTGALKKEKVNPAAAVCLSCSVRFFFSLYKVIFVTIPEPASCAILAFRRIQRPDPTSILTSTACFLLGVCLPRGSSISWHWHIYPVSLPVASGRFFDCGLQLRNQPFGALHGSTQPIDLCWTALGSSCHGWAALASGLRRLHGFATNTSLYSAIPDHAQPRSNSLNLLGQY